MGKVLIMIMQRHRNVRIVLFTNRLCFFATFHFLSFLTVLLLSSRGDTFGAKISLVTLFENHTTGIPQQTLINLLRGLKGESFGRIVCAWKDASRN